MQSGHSADSEKRKDKGGTMSQRHGYHLDDIDDDDDDGDEYESIVKQQSRDSREGVRKPLRNKVKAARKVISKEGYVDEGRRTSLSALAGESQKRKEDKERGRPESEDEKHRRLRLGRYSPSQYKYEKDEKGNLKFMGRKDGEED
jgi:hypothetical protein